MIIYLINHKFRFETENLCRLFFQNDKFEFREVKDELPNDDYIYTELRQIDKKCAIMIKVNVRNQYKEDEQYIDLNVQDFDEDTCERELAVMLFKSLSEIMNMRPSWGIITGVRPVKLLKTLVDLYGEEGAYKYFKENLLCSDKKLELAKKTLKNQEKILNLSGERSVSLYISIPFCPSRCSYCSFVSQSIEKAKHLIPDYTDLLCKEIEYSMEMINKLNLRLETIYIGGGTPTSIDAIYFKQIMDAINKNVKEVKEFTVEAGRPDTITREKLEVLKSGGVTRISINPQTFNNEVLNIIGRRHSAEEIIESFNLARQIGFNNINMDIIVGLPSDNLESFANTLSNICRLDPEGVTVHTLSLKRASSLTLGGSKIDQEKASLGSEMMKLAEITLEKNNYMPYYLYRQSCMIDNLENVGWSKKDFECFYNIYIMDETHSIFACGAGAVTKIKDQRSGHLERLFNYKFPYEYIKDFNKIIEKKRRIEEVYDEFH